MVNFSTVVCSVFTFSEFISFGLILSNRIHDDLFLIDA
jgi:hypothetical protein